MCMASLTGNDDGEMPDIYSVGMVCFGAVVLVANMRVLIIS